LRIYPPVTVRRAAPLSPPEIVELSAVKPSPSAG